MSIGNNIRKYRKAAGLTQKDVAKQLFVTKETIGNYEREFTMIPITLLKPMAKALNVSVEALLEDEEDEEDED